MVAFEGEYDWQVILLSDKEMLCQKTEFSYNLTVLNIPEGA